MWTDTIYAQSELALSSDLTDAEWAILEPFLPPPSHVGRPRKSPLRRIIEADAATVLPAGINDAALVLSAARQRAMAFA